MKVSEYCILQAQTIPVIACKDDYDDDNRLIMYRLQNCAINVNMPVK